MRCLCLLITRSLAAEAKSDPNLKLVLCAASIRRRARVRRGSAEVIGSVVETHLAVQRIVLRR